MVSNSYCLFLSTVLCHIAAVPSSLALSPCPWWKQNQCPTRLQQERQTTTGGLCRVTSGTWSACTFRDREGMPATPRQHRGATPVFSSTTSPEQSHSHTSRTEAGIMEAEGELSGRTGNAHDAQLLGQEVESFVGDLRLAKHKDTRCERKHFFSLLHSVVSQFQMCLQLQREVTATFLYNWKAVFLPLGASSVHILNTTHPPPNVQSWHSSLLTTLQ